MTLSLISREKLEYIAKNQLRYQLQDAEKDYFLTLVMQIIFASSLKSSLVFKGGTAIYHCFLNQYRFSEDLDFTAVTKPIFISHFRKILKNYPIFEFKKVFSSKNTLKIERLKYQGILATPNSLKIEIDKKQNVYLPSLSKKYHNFWGLNFKVKVMHPVEIVAEKIRACNDRFRYRDFYDLYLLVNKLKINIRRSIRILSRKEIRKTISQQNLIRNLQFALEEISQKSDTIAYQYEISKHQLATFIAKLKLSPIIANIKLQ